MKTFAEYNGNTITINGKIFAKTNNPDVTDIIIKDKKCYWWIVTGNDCIPVVRAIINTEVEAQFCKKLIKAHNDDILDSEEFVKKMDEYLGN